ncbi:T-cell receptor beta chain V region 3H.25 [Fukomys damarensis]|nr:T-cell receptor beta chain V region 3H.25 [Fukomys damarensis]
MSQYHEERVGRAVAHRKDAGGEWGSSACCHLDATMATWFLCSVTLCLLGAGFSDDEVTQEPRHLVKRNGQSAKMSCVPKEGHNAVYWYHQKQNEELKFLIYFQNKKVVDQIDMAKTRFLTEYTSNSPCSVEIKSSELEDSGLYFCASSQSTALKCSSPLVLKPHGLVRKQQMG